MIDSICVCCVHMILLVVMNMFYFNLIVLVSVFGDFLLSLLFARVCVVPSMLLLKFFSLCVSCVCQAASMYESVFARCLFLYMVLCVSLLCVVASAFCLCLRSLCFSRLCL